MFYRRILVIELTNGAGESSSRMVPRYAVHYTVEDACTVYSVEMKNHYIFALFGRLLNRTGRRASSRQASAVCGLPA